ERGFFGLAGWGTVLGGLFLMLGRIRKAAAAGFRPLGVEQLYGLFGALAAHALVIELSHFRHTRIVFSIITPPALQAVARTAAAGGLVLAGAAAHLGSLVLSGAALLLVVGMIDDVWSLRPETKLVAQAAAAVLAVAGGLRLDCFGHTPVLGAALLDAVLTGVWIVLITNALNLTDGLDGLASGIGLISLLWMAATAVHTGD